MSNSIRLFSEYIIINKFYNPFEFINYLSKSAWYHADKDLSFILSTSVVFYIVLVVSLVLVLGMILNNGIRVIKILKIIGIWYLGYLIISFPMIVYIFYYISNFSREGYKI